MLDLNNSDKLLGNVRCDVRWLPLSAFTARRSLSCIDGRYSHPRLGAPGGDMGEFLLLLAAYEQSHGEPCPQWWIERALTTLLEWCGPFHMSTDEHALALLGEVLDSLNPRSWKVDKSVEGVERLLRHPHPQARSLLEELVVLPETQGCGHLAQILHFPEDYRICVESVEAALRTFYRWLWIGSPSVDLAVLRGDHRERAVVEVVAEGEPKDIGYAPSLLVEAHGPSIFVEHPQTRREYRRDFLHLLWKRDLVETEEERAGLWRAAETLEDLHREHTLAAVCPTLPRYRIELTGWATAAISEKPVRVMQPSRRYRMTRSAS